MWPCPAKCWRFREEEEAEEVVTVVVGRGEVVMGEVEEGGVVLAAETGEEEVEVAAEEWQGEACLRMGIGCVSDAESRAISNLIALLETPHALTVLCSLFSGHVELTCYKKEDDEKARKGKERVQEEESEEPKRKAKPAKSTRFGGGDQAGVFECV